MHIRKFLRCSKDFWYAKITSVPKFTELSNIEPSTLQSSLKIKLFTFVLGIVAYILVFTSHSRATICTSILYIFYFKNEIFIIYRPEGGGLDFLNVNFPKVSPFYIHMLSCLCCLGWPTWNMGWNICRLAQCWCRAWYCSQFHFLLTQTELFNWTTWSWGILIVTVFLCILALNEQIYNNLKTWKKLFHDLNSTWRLF